MLFIYLRTSGNPISTKAALTNLSIIEEERLIGNVIELGEYFKKQLLDLQTKHEIIGDVRGKGLALGVELVEKTGLRKSQHLKKTAAVCYRAF